MFFYRLIVFSFHLFQPPQSVNVFSLSNITLFFHYFRSDFVIMLLLVLVEQLICIFVCFLFWFSIYGSASRPISSAENRSVRKQSRMSSMYTNWPLYKIACELK